MPGSVWSSSGAGARRAAELVPQARTTRVVRRSADLVTEKGMVEAE